MAIETVASRYGLGFLPLQAEEYDFVIPVSRLDRAAVRRFVTILHDGAVRAELARMLIPDTQQDSNTFTHVSPTSSATARVTRSKSPTSRFWQVRRDELDRRIFKASRVFGAFKAPLSGR